MKAVLRGINCSSARVRHFSSTNVLHKDLSCKLLVLGGGAGGCSVASKFVSKLGKNNVVIVDPADKHYYQPMLTMIGGGIKKLPEASRSMKSVLPKDALWVQEAVSKIDPKNNTVLTSGGKEIQYEYLVVALGIDLNFEKIPGLVEALEQPESGVASNYSPKYVERTFKFVKNLDSGNAVFTFPATPVKCAGAPLKACFISEDYIRRAGKRDKININYMTSLPVIFSAKHYASKLREVCQQRNINVSYQKELIEVKPEAKKAVFRNVTDPKETTEIEYSFLHATPPMSTAPALKKSPELLDAAGYLNVNKGTLQSVAFPNIYGIGDCTNLPTSKTAAAVASQSGILYKNLSNDMNGVKSDKILYDGYTSCPLVTGYGTCILAEFDYDLEPLETFPLDQRTEHQSMYFMKKEMMPVLYWNAMLKGYWNGPSIVRKILHLGIGK